MLQATVLGDSVADLVMQLAKIPIVGGDVSKYAQRAFALVRSEATSGAKAAIPEIKAQVREEVGKSVKPLLYLSLAMGGVALATAVGAVLVVRRR